MTEVETVTELPLPVTPAPKPAKASPLLQVKLVHLRYGLVPALRGISLEVGAGEMVALLGANGAGKTSTLRAVSGMVRPTSGQILFDGQRLDGLDPWDVVRRGVAHMPEGRELFPPLSVRENLRYGYFPRRRAGGAAYRAALDLVFATFPRLAERQRQGAGTLSGGEQQMLTAGMALMSEPRLLLVDELSLGLAPLVVAELFAVLRRVNATGTAVLLVEQFVPLALAHTTRAYVLAKGEVAIQGASADLADDPELTASYLGGRLGEAEPAALEEGVQHAMAAGEGSHPTAVQEGG
ncbi:MAG: ABC transporter ATP-binding protein [Candidatus Dormibacteria bacterium]